jgi:hypothetical protein
VIGWYHSHPHITVNPSHVGMQCVSFLSSHCYPNRLPFLFITTYLVLIVLVLFCLFVLDILTQWNYQMLDKGFIGLIFSCFNNDTSNNVRNALCASVRACFCFSSSFPFQMFPPLLMLSCLEWSHSSNCLSVGRKEVCRCNRPQRRGS